MNNSINEKIIKIVEENGIQIAEDGTLVDLTSIQFISMIVSIEQEFCIQLPDDFLLAEHVLDIESLEAVVEQEAIKG